MNNEQIVNIPDLGGASGVDVIEILVKVGDTVSADTAVLTLESDKASMEIPASIAGEVTAILVQIGDKVAANAPMLKVVVASDLRVAEATVVENTKALPIVETAKLEATLLPEPKLSDPKPLDPVIAPSVISDAAVILASPSVRRFARTLGVELHNVQGSLRNARVSREDIENYVKQRLHSKAVVLPQATAIDFSQFGGIEHKPINKIKRITGTHLHASWSTIPHVTQFDTADITELEAFRKSELARNKSAVKLTLLAFVCKIVSQALAVFPQFNSSLDASGDNLIYKKYYNIGIAVETPAGLVVPVIKQVNLLSIYEIAAEMARLSTKAREKGLMPADMSGGCFTISSLGGIGGTAFTPIVNHPEVAILGLSKAAIQPMYLDGAFVPKLMLPLSLSYDHRVIDGAEGARFTRYISEALNDIRRILL